MKNNWIITSLLLGIIGGIITYLLTWNWKLSMVISIIIAVIVFLINPKTRYMKAFYVVVFPLLSNIYFTIASKAENFNIQAGLKELDITTVVVLGLISMACLILDFLERNGKLNGTFLTFKRNKAGNINGDNNTINQTNA